MKWLSFIFAFLLSPLAASAADGPAVELPPGVPIFLQNADGPGVRFAVDDLRRDLKNVLGKESPLYTDAKQLPADFAGKPAIVVTTAAIDGLPGPEANRVSIETAAGTGARAAGAATAPPGPHVVLRGNDPRGTIYAIYTFSDKFLDVPPLWVWATWKPARKASVSVPAGTDLRFGTPWVRWRAWFPNDVDLLTTWIGEMGGPQTPKQLVPRGNFDLVLETMLRLKVNCIDLDDLRDYPAPSAGLLHARAARDRGIVVTTTHTSPFGAPFKAWAVYWRSVRNQDPPPLTLSGADKILEFWRYHAEMIKRENLESIWMVGMRGQGDHGFAENFPDAPADDAGRGRVLKQFLEKQVQLIKQVMGQEHPVMRTVLYNEQAGYFANHYMRPPDEPSLIWNFCAARRDHFPNIDVRGFDPSAPDSETKHNTPDDPRLIGYYLNLQFTNTGAHVVEGEGPWKEEANFRYVGSGKHGKLEFAVVNVGNVREFVFGISAAARMLWDMDHYSSDAYAREYAERYFGAEHASDIAGLYKDYFDGYWQQRKPDLPDFPRQYVFQDLRMARAGRTLLQVIEGGTPNMNPLDEQETGIFRVVPADSGAKDQVSALLVGTEASAKKMATVLKRADAIAKELPPDRLRFFDDNLRTPVRFMVQCNVWLNALAHATAALPDKKTSAAWLAYSDKAIDGMWGALVVAQHEPFVGWYVPEQKFAIGAVKQKTQQVMAKGQ